MGKLAIISEETVRKIVTRQLAFDAVRAAFEAVATDRAHVFDVVIGTGLNDGEAFAIKSGTDDENEMVGFKCGTYWAGNYEKGLPAHGSTILLLDLGVILAVLRLRQRHGMPKEGEFRLPFGPLIPLTSCAVVGWLLLQMPLNEAATIAAMIGACVVFYLVRSVFRGAWKQGEES